MRRWTTCPYLTLGIIFLWTLAANLPVKAAPTNAAPAVAPKPNTTLPLPVAAPATASAPVAPASASVSAPATPAATTTSVSTPVVANPDMVCPVLPDEKADTKYAKVLDGKIYYFCCARCLTKFSEDPQKYIAEMQNRATLYASAPAADEGAQSVSDVISHVAGSSKPEPPLTDEERIVRFAGYFHPLLVHFPIALVFTAALAEFFLAITGRRFFAPVSLFAIRFAAAMIVFTALSGWAAASSGGGDVASSSDWILEWHRWLGIGTASFTVLVAIISLWITQESDRLFYRWLLYLSAAAVGVTGHFGGMLVYGQNYFRW